MFLKACHPGSAARRWRKTCDPFPANKCRKLSTLLVVDASGIKSVGDMKGKALSCDRKGHLGELISQQILKVYGLSHKDIT